MWSPLGVLALTSALFANFTHGLITLKISTVPEYLGVYQPTSASAPAFADGYTIYSNIGGAYKYYEDLVNWNTARKNCMELGSSLAVIDSLEKYHTIRRLIGNKGPHVGIHRMFDNEEWVNVATGLPVAGIPWTEDSYTDLSARNCVAMWDDGSGAGADECSRLRPYVCEFPVQIA